MPIDVKSPNDMKKLIVSDIDKLADQMLWLAMNYSESFLVNEYTRECLTFWPLTIGGKEVKDPVTGEDFTEDESPPNVVKHIKIDFTTISEHIKAGRIWVEVSGKPELEKLERAARMQEVFGCRPWSRLKSDLSQNFGTIVKQYADTIKNKFGLK